ncbi:MAG: sulfite exporter TauE/SafE family protein [Proteobacteria bacterium]|nr:sulfite exporter TauE/SafE family protein [Pseudomonadota bacterium]
MAISLLLGVLIGAVLGLTGAGGGILAVPALVFGMGWSMQHAAPVALIAVAGGAAIGALEGLRQGLVRWRGALLMAAVGMAMTPFGVRLANVLPQSWLLLLFAIVMLLVAARLLHANTAAIDQHVISRRAGGIDPETGRFDWNAPTILLLGAIGALTGLMTGLLGVGGGFVMMPLLRRYTAVSMHGIVATSLLVIALVGATGVASALLHGVTVPLIPTLLFAAATAIGMLFGRKAAGHLSPRHVQYGFAALLVMVAGAMLFKWLAAM